MTDTFVADVTRSIRRSLFHRLRGLGVGQSELTALIASTTRAAVERARVSDLAIIAAAAGPMAEALGATAPEDPALAAFIAAKTGRSSDVILLLDPPE